MCCSDSDSQEQSITESDDEIELQNCGDIDLIVHEISKLFGHLGTPEYCHGASAFRAFLGSKVRESNGIDKEYFLNLQNVQCIPPSLWIPVALPLLLFLPDPICEGIW